MTRKTSTEMKYHSERLGEFEPLNAFKQRVVEHPVWHQLAAGELPLASYQKMLLHFFPLVENFPKFMALALAKASVAKPGHENAKNWLIGNIKVEQNHANWFRDWAEGIGVDAAELNGVRPAPEIDAIVHYLWSTAHNGSLSESLAATNVGIEWATGEWSMNIVSSAEHYFQQNLPAKLQRRAMAWIRAHARYDDTHPYEAMELVVECAEDEEDLSRAILAAERSLEYYAIGLDEVLVVERAA